MVTQRVDPLINMLAVVPLIASVRMHLSRHLLKRRRVGTRPILSAALFCNRIYAAIGFGAVLRGTLARCKE